MHLPECSPALGLTSHAHRCGPWSQCAPTVEGTPRGGVKRRLQKAAAAEHAEDLPFNRCMRRDWARGWLASNKVLEYGHGASDQGAAGVGRLAGTDFRNAHRQVVSAIGWPEKAPDVEWIKVPVKGGHMAPHPMFCPIAQVERLVADEKRFVERLRGPAGDIEYFRGGHA